MEALFTSQVGGEPLRRRMLDVIAEASDLSESRAVDLHVMTFAFTDTAIAGALATAAARHAERMAIRLLADWSQRIRFSGRKVNDLGRLRLPNLRIRYKSDQPYAWDAAAERLRWSYHASRGLLHHKTLGVLVDGRPWKLLCGSFNWTANAARSYENLLVVSDKDAWERELMSRVELEFEAMWSDGRATLSPDEAHLHYRAIQEAYRRDPATSPNAVVGAIPGRGAPLHVLRPGCYPSDEGWSPTTCGETTTRDGPRAAIAFSSRRPDDEEAQSGYSVWNRAQRFVLHKLAKSKRVPVTLTTLALDTIFAARPGEILKVAMFGLSTRVPEFGALLDAARRGVLLQVLLDGAVGARAARRLAAAREVEQLPILVRAGRRMMHEKYVVHPASGTVLTGTANMTTDASTRHSEHRIAVRGCPELAARFDADFDAIWERLSDSGDGQRRQLRPEDDRKIGSVTTPIPSRPPGT